MASRCGCDHVIIAQEIIHSLRNRKRNEGFIVIKIDLEKAYDRLEWCFIRKVLHFGFPMNMVKLIMSCISSSSSFLLFNGEKLPSFSLTRGIRQGNPVSPFIFLLCMSIWAPKLRTCAILKFGLKWKPHWPRGLSLFFRKRLDAICESLH